MAGDPNLQIVEQKPVPAPDNILHQFTNVTYKISLLSFRSIQKYNDLAEKGSWDWCHGNVPSICYTLFSSGGISDEAGGIFLPARHPVFGLDFYIESMSMSGVMGMNSTSRATNVFDLAMSVVEPNGTTLLDRFHEVLTEDGPNWTEKPLLVQIDFTGYDDAGSPRRIKPATRWIPVRLSKLDFGISGQGTNYSLQFIAMATLETTVNPMNRALNLKTIRGSGLKDILDHLEKEFNREQKQRALGSELSGYKPNEPSYSPQTQEFPDEIEFRVGTGGGPAAARLIGAKISPNVAKQTLLKERPGNAASKGGRRAVSPKEKYKNDSSIRYHGGEGRDKYKLELTAPGQSMLSVIEKVIRDSTYITEQLKENTTLGPISDARDVLVDPEKGLDWFKITYVKLLKENQFDRIRNQYARKTIIQIDPYKVVDPNITGGKAKPGVDGIRNVARSYGYIYSGQNTDIRNLELSFNNAFLMAMSGLDMENATSNKGKDEKESVNKNTNPGAANQQDGASKLPSNAQTIMPSNNKFNKDPHASDKQRTGATLMENLYRMPGSDMMTIDMEIVGDPGYIQQDGILTMATPNKTGIGGGGGSAPGQDPRNGAILCDLDDAHFYLLFKTPRDYNEATGLADFSKSDGGSTLSGYFRIWQIDSTFQNGEFTQTLQATRIYNQWRENIDNPEKNVELMSAEEASNYDFEDSKVAANTLISPGSAQVANEANVGLDAFGGAGVQVAPTPYDADEFANASLPAQEAAKTAELSFEASEADWANNEFAGVGGSLSENNANRNFVSPHADFNTAALQSTPTVVAEVRAAESRQSQILSSRISSRSSGTLASQLTNTPAGVTPIRPNPAEAAGPITFRASPAIEQYRSTPSFVTTTGGTVLTAPKGSPGGTVALDRHPNISTYEVSDQTTVRSNDTIMGIERQTIINAGIVAGSVAVGVLAASSPIARVIAAATGVLSASQLSAAWERGNSASEANETIHNKYGNNVPSWKKTGYLLDIISEKNSTTTGGGGGF